MSRSKRILVVDDEQQNRELLEAILVPLGFDVENAADGREALRKYASDVDLVLLDVMMPGLDGFEVVRRIRRDLEHGDLPVIMVTGLTSKEDRLKAAEAGANDFISKPIDRVELTVRMNSLLRMKEAQDAIKRHKAQLETEVRRRTAALKESEARYRTLIESAPIGILIVRRGEIAYVNPTFTAMLDYGAADEIIGVGVENLIEGELTHALADRPPEDSEGNPTLVLSDLKARARNDRPLDLSVWVSPVEFEGERANLAFVVDVTEERELKQRLSQAQKMEALGTLAGGVAHDFNNILFAIMGFAEMAQEDSVEGSLQHSNLTQVLEAANRAKDLVAQILAFSRRGDLRIQPIDMRPIVKETLRFLRASVPTTIRINFSVPGELGSVMGNSTQIHQVLMNLSSNAAHAMRDHGGELRVTLEETDLDRDAAALEDDMAPGRYVRLIVSDTGRGMPPQVLERILEPYFTTKAPGEGTGLGLSVVHGIVKSYGGGMTVESRLNEGSRFTLYFPVYREEAVQEDRVLKPAPTGAERILLVDDEPNLVEMVYQMLDRLGYSVVSTSASSDALEIFSAAPEEFDLVLTDMTMPGLTGVDLAKRMREIRPDTRLVLITGFSELPSDEDIELNGVSALLRKPIFMDQLAETVRRALDGGRPKET